MDDTPFCGCLFFLFFFFLSFFFLLATISRLSRRLVTSPGLRCGTIDERKRAAMQSPPPHPSFSPGSGDKTTRSLLVSNSRQRAGPLTFPLSFIYRIAGPRLYAGGPDFHDKPSPVTFLSPFFFLHTAGERMLTGQGAG